MEGEDRWGGGKTIERKKKVHTPPERGNTGISLIKLRSGTYRRGVGAKKPHFTRKWRMRLGKGVGSQRGVLSQSSEKKRRENRTRNKDRPTKIPREKRGGFTQTLG